MKISSLGRPARLSRRWGMGLIESAGGLTSSVGVFEAKEVRALRSSLVSGRTLRLLATSRREYRVVYVVQAAHDQELHALRGHPHPLVPQRQVPIFVDRGILSFLGAPPLLANLSPGVTVSVTRPVTSIHTPHIIEDGEGAQGRRCGGGPGSGRFSSAFPHSPAP